jgi:hypothetical protein
MKIFLLALSLSSTLAYAQLPATSHDGTDQWRQYRQLHMERMHQRRLNAEMQLEQRRQKRRLALTKRKHAERLLREQWQQQWGNQWQYQWKNPYGAFR